ncbi:MAG: hypothetical protein HC808_17425 [Candidatus Competibacteraceae bacterium]|nr:hypothetical protein [Candidatus Competibacteraceae bacterium]
MLKQCSQLGCVVSVFGHFSLEWGLAVSRIAVEHKVTDGLHKLHDCFPGLEFKKN